LFALWAGVGSRLSGRCGLEGTAASGSAANGPALLAPRLMCWDAFPLYYAGPSTAWAPERLDTHPASARHAVEDKDAQNNQSALSPQMRRSSALALLCLSGMMVAGERRRPAGQGRGARPRSSRRAGGRGLRCLAHSTARGGSRGSSSQGGRTAVQLQADISGHSELRAPGAARSRLAAAGKRPAPAAHSPRPASSPGSAGPSSLRSQSPALPLLRLPPLSPPLPCLPSNPPPRLPTHLPTLHRALTPPACVFSSPTPRLCPDPAQDLRRGLEEDHEQRVHDHPVRRVYQAQVVQRLQRHRADDQGCAAAPGPR
jgi:hypothetical protein